MLEKLISKRFYLLYLRFNYKKHSAMKKLILFFLIIPSALFSQQVVRGKVVDKESQFPLPGVNIQFINADFDK